MPALRRSPGALMRQKNNQKYLCLLLLVVGRNPVQAEAASFNLLIHL